MAGDMKLRFDSVVGENMANTRFIHRDCGGIFPVGRFAKSSCRHAQVRFKLQLQSNPRFIYFVEQLCKFENLVDKFGATKNVMQNCIGVKLDSSLYFAKNSQCCGTRIPLDFASQESGGSALQLKFINITSYLL